jgi:BirA family biotin operon repressor/biotin-[acetyl-CoA-carboxylase] ligase
MASINRHDVLTSTNDEARRLADRGAEHGTVVQAVQQTGGRGRQGRRWISPPGNAYVSVVLRPPGPEVRWPELGFVTALSVADAVDACAGTLRASLKWPNDVLLDGAKVAGILMEGDGSGAMIAGIGINVSHAPMDLPYPATALAWHAPADVDGTVAVLLAALDRWWTVWRHQGFIAVREAWLRRGPQPGQSLMVIEGARRRYGCFAGLDEDGALLLDTAEGVRRIVAGDVVP